MLAAKTGQEVEQSGSPTKTPGSETRCLDGSVSDYYTITALDVTPDDSKINSFAWGHHQHCGLQLFPSQYSKLISVRETAREVACVIPVGFPV